jgi:hypothetical protein
MLVLFAPKVQKESSQWQAMSETNRAASGTDYEMSRALKGRKNCNKIQTKVSPFTGLDNLI